MMEYHIIPVGDQALSIRFANEINASINLKIQNILKIITQKQIHGIKALIPSYTALKIDFNGLQTDFSQIKKELEPIIKQALTSNSISTRVVTIPVCYEAPFNPDLSAVAKFANISEEEVINRHAQKQYLIYFLGFLPGFAYMGKVDRSIAIPRLDKPRLKISAGSVGIAGYQTGFYPVDSPGGWQIIGKTPLILFDRNNLYNFYHSGDLIQFQPIDKNEFEAIHKACLNNEYQVKVAIKNV